MREFPTGANRDDDEDKIDPEGALSPLVIERFCQYMREHETQADGAHRSSDNWQKGIPLKEYMKSMWRHLLQVWKMSRGWIKGDIAEALCALMFNVQGYLHEILVSKCTFCGSDCKQESYCPSCARVGEEEGGPKVPDYSYAKMTIWPPDETGRRIYVQQ
jgi:hypothetical protein